MQQKILTMLDLQAAMNARVNPQWRAANLPWYRAIWTECAEMLDHYGWKWWKHQKPDMEQVHLELVDIWHFALSDLLMRGDSPEQIAAQTQVALAEPTECDDFRESIEQMAQRSIASRSADIRLFAAMMQLAELDFDKLFKTYVGKNVLNFFRQDHGYKEGSYIKVWQGREDNEHLAELLATIDADSPSFSEDLYQRLADVYPG
ncbi:dUTP diphosphatase [endosymbiont of Ridgeia piscesae]|jgi:dimeric dUTPase (all-alpha-NTP-PPase superfamily)|uniref:dUTPase n=1 Tax=endosymbiont of Ridgeia piscesae TaxID=54398 RepID=A0A0T5YUQ8_9GAMM|nr:dUTP diphosphatase [endosymbiont of Ridgeia piscesae]KRT54070.1 dUTPase [endosymbiont of Ridgeia piscesae]KRT59128.1 dUTPase [endosymbiont of Ridgeia piscesae]